MSHKMKLVKTEGIKPIPADIYPAKLVAITDGEGNYGKYFLLEFAITDGPYSGERRTIIAGNKLIRTRKGNSKLVGIVETLSGKQLDFDQEFELEGYLGSQCRIILGEAEIKDGINTRI